MASKITGYIGKLNPGNGTEYSLGSTAYGVCGTAAATAAKVVDMTGFTLMEGATIHVKFTYTNTAASPTLNVNSTGAKPIVQYGTTAASTTAETSGWQAGAVLCLTYDGTSWVRDQGYNTNTIYSLPDATTSVKGGVIVGSGLSVSSGTVSHADSSSQESITANGRTYITGVTLDTYGHVTGLTTGTETVNEYTLPTASADTLGGVKIGDGITITNGVISATQGVEVVRLI